MSSKKQLDVLGERMKAYERLQTSSQCIPNLPIYIRLDGRGFSNFTRHMKRPYDEAMSKLMIETSQYLLEELNATIAYTQSDEISLVLFNSYNSPAIFDAKIQKLVSTSASLATAYFNSNFKQVFGIEAIDYSPRLPTFDSRVFELPNWEEAANTILWRYLDARKNSVQMLAQSLYSHKELQKLQTGKLLDKMLVEKDIDWNTYPEFFKNGVFSSTKKYVKQTETGAALRSKVAALNLNIPFHLMSIEDQIKIIQYSTRQVLGWTIAGDITYEYKVECT